ncbi:MAG: hypothetical protein K5899_12115 [Bacteroidaceae bacterium]|nr:hypothetical protein [Bacteroidaceae bacterium]
MKKSYLFLAAAITLVGCSSEELIGDYADNFGKENQAIVFSNRVNKTTRADFTGAEAATKLDNKFVVFGYKGSKTVEPSSTVFDNYFVEYTENTANTTESNSSNWEYVGKTPILHATENGIVAQTIKYWDYSADQYDFFAWSTGAAEAIYTGTPADPDPADPTDPGQVLVSEMAATKATSPATGLVNAYTFTGSAKALAGCYISDLVTVKKNGKATGDTFGVADYGYSRANNENPVTLKFRQLGTKVRIGIYETVPGYSVKDVKFYTKDGKLDATTAGDDDTPGVVASGQIVDSATLFSAGADIYKEGTYTVYFPTVDASTNADNNQAHITFAPKAGAEQAKNVNWGGLDYTGAEKAEKTTGNVFLGRTSNTATFAGDAADNYYVVYLPNSEGANLNLRVDFTLESIDGSGEIINVKNAKAQVPSIYTQWKPGFAYTYLFKISDKTNGRTGVYDPTQPDDATINSDPAGLYPITFDAIVVNAEDDDQTQETITTVMTPSITTYQKGSKVVNNDEYLATTGDIFVTVNDGESYAKVEGINAGDDVSSYYKQNESTKEYEKCGTTETAVDGTDYYELANILDNGKLQTLTGKAALYTLPEYRTEAEVVDALQYGSSVTTDGKEIVTGRSGLVLTEATSTLTNTVEFGADGNAIEIKDTETEAGAQKALRFTPSAGTYAFVYTKAPATGTPTELYEPVTKADGASVEGLFRFALKAATAGDVQKGVKYFANSDASTGMITAFLGQGVSNLYTRSGAGTDADPYVFTIASGYAKTGTTYYYKGAGANYNKAHNVAYADFETETLYTFDGTNYTEKPAGTPQDGIAYYYKEADDSYTYCVILPQQADGLYELDDTTKVACSNGEKAVNGMIYFDKYTKNNGEYYTKVIKVQ